jgi:hypothetical protein
MKSLEILLIQKDYRRAETELENLKNQISKAEYWKISGLIKENTNDYASARYSYERLKWLSPLQAKNWSKVEEIKQKLSLVETESPQIADETFHYFMTSCPTMILYILAASIILIQINFLKKINKRWMVLLFVMALLPAVLSTIYFKEYQVKILTKDLSILSGPSGIFPPVATLPSGSKVIYKTEGKWNKIVYPGLAIGWAKEIIGRSINKDE